MTKKLSLLAGFGLLATAPYVSAATPPSPLTSSEAAVAAPVRPLLIPIGPPPGGGGGSPAPATSMKYFDRNVASKTIELDLSNGVIELISVTQNKITIQKGTSSTVFTIDQVMLQEANGNTTVAAANKSALLASIASPGFTSRFKQLVAGANSLKPVTPSMIAPPGLGSSGDPARPGLQVLATFNGLAAPGVTYAPMLLPGGGGGSPFGCSGDWGCEMDQVDWGGDGYDFYFYSQASQGSPNTPDYQYFTRWREDQCAATADDRVDSLEAVGLMTVACMTVETGVGVLACAGAGAGVIKTMDRGATDSANCLGEYPGPGKWQ